MDQGGKGNFFDGKTMVDMAMGKMFNDSLH